MAKTKSLKQDKYGSVKCEKCGKFYSPSFIKCPRCCKHNELELTEEWHLDGWELDVTCSECGKNYGFDRQWLINNFKLIRKHR